MFKLKLKGLSAEAFQSKIKSKFVDETLKNEMQTQVIDQLIKPSIAVGSSPVRGQRRFAAYKNPKKYPAKKKGSRPVNLKLTGDLLDNYVSEKVNSNRLSIGIRKNANADIKEYAEANNVGNQFIAARRFVPVKGETFTVTITRKIRDIFAKRLAKILNK